MGPSIRLGQTIANGHIVYVGHVIEFLNQGFREPGAHERDVPLKLLGMSETGCKQYWRAQVFRGHAQAEPIAVFSNGMRKEAVMAFTGAVALVDAQDVKPGMKIV